MRKDNPADRVSPEKVRGFAKFKQYLDELTDTLTPQN
jgi:hypothetical protein